MVTKHDRRSVVVLRAGGTSEARKTTLDPDAQESQAKALRARSAWDAQSEATCGRTRSQTKEALVAQRIVRRRTINPYAREIVSRGQRIVRRRVIDPYAREIHKRPGAA